MDSESYPPEDADGEFELYSPEDEDRYWPVTRTPSFKDRHPHAAHAQTQTDKPKPPPPKKDPPNDEDNLVIVMTASKRASLKTGEENVVRIDRLSKTAVDAKAMHYVAEGPFKGIMVNKGTRGLSPVTNPHVRMEFTACLLPRVDSIKPTEQREQRELRYWFKPGVKGEQQVAAAKEYFKQLIKPEAFPRDYVNFIKKAVILMKNFTLVRRLELVLKPVPPPKLIEEPPVKVVKNTPVKARPPSPPPPPPPSPPPPVEEPVENFITVLTPAVYDYQYLPEVPVSRKRFVTFRVRAQADAHVALSSVYGDIERHTYEVVLGAANNSVCLIRDGGEGDVVKETRTPGVLSSQELREFWISWAATTLEVGRGSKVGMDSLLVWRIPATRQHSINCLAVSTGTASDGEWEFVELLLPPKPEDNTKFARRGKIRVALLWAAKKKRMLQVLENAYPFNLNTGQLLKLSMVTQADTMAAVVVLKDLQLRGLLTEVSRGQWMRAAKAKGDKKHEVKIVKELPTLPVRNTPTICIITALFCEKLAVDTMLTDKVTYVKYTNEGENEVYTFGRVGEHNVVSVKLARLGISKKDKTSADNTVTRVLGTFHQVAHVLLVGVGGAVPHFSEWKQHVRLGDVVVSDAKGNGPLYLYCERVRREKGAERPEYENSRWWAAEDALHEAVKQVRGMYTLETTRTRPWETNLTEALPLLDNEGNYRRPLSKTDKLYGWIEEDRELALVEHPRPPKGAVPRDNKPRVHYGPVGCSSFVAHNEMLRMDYAAESGVMCFDASCQAIMESLEKMEKQSFCLIRGMADYVDGTVNKEWQPYAALSAAAYMKTLINSITTKRRSRYSYY